MPITDTPIMLRADVPLPQSPVVTPAPVFGPEITADVPLPQGTLPSTIPQWVTDWINGA